MDFKSLSILSHKGGVGKTSIAINIAAHLAMKGKNVCLLENDLSGPSFMTFFDREVSWLNDLYFDGEQIENCLQDVSSQYNLSGKLLIGFANPSANAIHHILQLDRVAAGQILQKLAEIRRYIKNRFNIEYFIVDSSPGIQLSTANSIVVTTSCLFIVKLSNADIYGTSQMIEGLINHLERPSFILANQIPEDVQNNEQQQLQIQTLIESLFNDNIQNPNISLNYLGLLPINLDMHQIEFKEALESMDGNNIRRTIFTVDHPTHRFSISLSNIIPSLFQE